MTPLHTRFAQFGDPFDNPLQLNQKKTKYNGIQDIVLHANKWYGYAALVVRKSGHINFKILLLIKPTSWSGERDSERT